MRRLFVLNSIYGSLSYLTKATGSGNVHGTCACVTEGRGINSVYTKQTIERVILRNETPLWWCRLRHCTTGTYSPRHHSNQSFSCSYWLSGDFTLELLISLKWRRKLGLFACSSCRCVYRTRSADRKCLIGLCLFVISCVFMWRRFTKGHFIVLYTCR